MKLTPFARLSGHITDTGISWSSFFVCETYGYSGSQISLVLSIQRLPTDCGWAGYVRSTYVNTGQPSQSATSRPKHKMLTAKNHTIPMQSREMCSREMEILFRQLQMCVRCCSPGGDAEGKVDCRGWESG